MDSPINFTTSALEYLDDGGRLLIIVLSNSYSKAQNESATQEILQRARLDFVIDMPTQLFFEQSRSVKTSIFGFTKTSNGHPHDALVTFVDMEDDGHEVRVGHGRRDKGSWDDIASHVRRAIRNGTEDREARSWRTPVFREDGSLSVRGVKSNPWPQGESHDLETAISNWQEARAEREAAQDHMTQVLADAGIGGFDA